MFRESYDVDRNIFNAFWADQAIDRWLEVISAKYGDVIKGHVEMRNRFQGLQNHFLNHIGSIEFDYLLEYLAETNPLLVEQVEKYRERFSEIQRLTANLNDGVYEFLLDNNQDDKALGDLLAIISSCSGVNRFEMSPSQMDQT